MVDVSTEILNLQKSLKFVKRSDFIACFYFLILLALVVSLLFQSLSPHCPYAQGWL